MNGKMEISELNKLLGNIDIYLLDQILKGRFTKEMKILDAGCGEGRNAVYFINSGYQVFGLDQEDLAIQYLRFLSKSLNQSYDAHRFQVGNLEKIPFHREAFDAVVCSAVLHFARDEENFWQMMHEMLRVLKPGGILWFRMTTAFGGILEESEEVGGGRYLLPDGSDRFLLNQEHVDKLLEMGLSLLEAPKSVLVHRKRAMGVFVMRKEAVNSQLN
jgi:SAM-dependent methyltransferase